VCEMAGRLPDHDRYSADDPGVRRCGMRAQEPSPQVVGQEPARVTWTADGPTQFAGAMMVVAGTWHGLIGLAGLPYRPVWSVIVIALDVAIVFALAKGRS